ncbi:Golgi apparatus membrane protein tvp23 [Fusarium musae]|uniref:Golgi apparatus membrane protein TVP23 n=1 Tax=Fusarium musae TaxID=1042133 RepID=A0A9P8IVN0_9HYPO|nr:Golgi apparatus membrane protein tvp23 [Fusarium musae]KAG9507544.1 Golgi apparatus membrane protein tvp23 [Fusarium musae]
MPCSKCPDLLSRSVDHKKHVRIVPQASSAAQSTNLPGRIMIFIITILLLAADFYYIKNIAGRRLVGLRWWNEVDPQTGESQWVFESSEPGTKTVNPTDSRFFWLALYIQPMLWVLMAILALVRLQFLWLPLVVIALVLTIMNTLAFSRCDKFSNASSIAGSAFGTGNLAGSLASNMVSNWFSRS